MALEVQGGNGVLERRKRLIWWVALGVAIAVGIMLLLIGLKKARRSLTE